MRRLGLDDVDIAAILLNDGLIVAIPTDTVYGLAARLGDPQALDALYVAKGRPETKPLPVLVGDPSAISGLLGDIPPVLARLVEQHWPGALTIVSACDDELASRVRSNDASIGLRCPDDPTARALLRITGPLCVTSANLTLIRHDRRRSRRRTARRRAFDGSDHPRWRTSGTASGSHQTLRVGAASGSS